MERESIKVAEKLRTARKELIGAINSILDRQDNKEMDLYECGLRADIYVDDNMESCEIIGISVDNGDGETYVHAKFFDNDEDVSISVPVGEVDNDDLLAILSTMENIEEDGE